MLLLFCRCCHETPLSIESGLAEEVLVPSPMCETAVQSSPFTQDNNFL